MRALWGIVLLAFVAGCHREKPPSKPPAAGSRLQSVPVRISTGPLLRTFLGQVATDPSASAQVMARLSALSVVSIQRFAGDRVRRGETVMVLKSPDFLSAESELASVLDNPGGAESHHVRGIRILAEQKLRLLGASQDEIERLERTRRPVDRYEVRSPISGILIRLGPAEGAQVRKGDLLFEVSDLTRLWVLAFLYPGQEAGIRSGEPVRVSSIHEDKTDGSGRILRIAPFIDPRTRTIPLRIGLENPNGTFRPDAWVRIRVPVAQPGGGPVYLVPDRAVVRTRNQKTAVYVVRGKKGPLELPVSVLGRKGPDVEVLGEFRTDDRVVTEGLLPLLSPPGS